MFDLGKISCDDCLSRPTSGLVVRFDDEIVLFGERYWQMA